MWWWWWRRILLIHFFWLLWSLVGSGLDWIPPALSSSIMYTPASYVFPISSFGSLHFVVWFGFVGSSIYLYPFASHRIASYVVSFFFPSAYLRWVSRARVLLNLAGEVSLDIDTYCYTSVLSYLRAFSWNGVGSSDISDVEFECFRK